MLGCCGSRVPFEQLEMVLTKYSQESTMKNFIFSFAGYFKDRS